ncbi:MAG: response regulator transcription factor [Acidimicrobiia bacterium]|nr:response regulator transcription factor [Acidimicrobiia bacterium]
MIRVIIADDHRVVRDGLRWMFDGESEIEVVGEAADGAELLELALSVPADIVLLDVSMPGMGGLEALEQLSASAPDLRVVMLSMHDKPVYVRRAVELGAAGYLLKSAGRDELLRALNAVADGNAYIQGEVTGPLLKAVASDETGLSPRELDVLRLVAAGSENKQVARELGLSEATVKSYLKSAYERLGVSSRAEAVAVALRRGLID